MSNTGHIEGMRRKVRERSSVDYHDAYHLFGAVTVAVALPERSRVISAEVIGVSRVLQRAQQAAEEECLREGPPSEKPRF